MYVNVQGLNAARNAFEQYLRSKKVELLSTVASAGDALSSKAKGYAPSDLGNLRREINYVVIEKKKTIKSLIRSDADYSLFVEEKTKPHWTSKKNLIGWARRKGIPVRLVQRSIAEKGTRAQPFMKPASEDVFPVFLKDVKKVMSTV